uniref:G-protein coupled receptors family 2 profile 2 domain-containing protein n=1 Tax=Amphimedon queenslandica TaxID=400682 RepID=A0A1X7TH74_AMPQE
MLATLYDNAYYDYIIILKFERSNFNGLTISGFAFNNTLNFNMQESSSNLTNREISRVVVPLSILNITNSESIDIAATLYKKANFFPVHEEVISSSSVMTVVGSAVISIIVGGIPDGTELIDPVVIILALNKEHVTNPHCAFWNFTGADGIGNWSIDGCTTVVDPNDLSNVTCYCDHLTNFALLVDISTRTGNGSSPPPFGVKFEFDTITYVGVSLSLVGLILTILTLLVFKKLRKKDSSKFHIQLCLSLCFVIITLVTGIDKISVRPLCISIGALIHYFSLVHWMWIGAEAVLMFQKIVIVFTNITWRYILIVSIVCWSVPLIPVAVLSGIDYNYYITLDKGLGFCFIGKEIPFFAAFLFPIALIILCNIIVFILVIRATLKNAIERKKQMSNSSFSVSEVLKMLLSFTGIMILFGLTWVSAAFTFISEPNVSYTVQFIFAFLNAFQGFFIFVFFILLNSEYRRQWTAIFCPSQKRTYSTTTPKAHKYNTYITTSQANGAALAIENATFDDKEGTMNTSM